MHRHDQSAYRPEIDGLRAIAVLSVIAFHVDPSVMPGGFIGVDVFFVISGYLIFRIVQNDLDNQRFSLLQFYVRRVRRILPALIAVMAACIPFAWVLLPPDAFHRFSGHLVAVTLFVANFRFWQDSGYFAPDAEKNPLIHTWSLAVEEQYYLLLPVTLILLWPHHRHRIPLVLAFAGMLSLGLAEYLSRTAPSANFYLLPTRVWEFCIGALCACYQPVRSRPLREALSLLGLTALVFSLALFNEETRFPSILALLPVGGTALIIFFSDRNTATGRLLSLRPMIWVGLISYSAYLWHQPILAFARHRGLQEEAHGVKAALVLATLGLAYLTWRFIEQPFRHPKPSAPPAPLRTLSSYAAVCAVVIACGLLQRELGTTQSAVYFASLNREQQAMYSFLERHTGRLDQMMFDDSRCIFWSGRLTDNFEHRFDECAKNSAKGATVIIGDSHAMNLFNALGKAAPDHAFIVSLSIGGCRLHDTRSKCTYEETFDFLKERSNQIDRIFYHQSGSYFIADRSGRVDSSSAFQAPELYSFANDNIDEVSQRLHVLADGLPVTWAGPFFEARLKLGPWLKPSDLRFNANALAAFENLDRHLTDRLSARNYRFAFIPINQDLSILQDTLIHGDCLIVKDEDHFSSCGEVLVGRLLYPKLIEP